MDNIPFTQNKEDDDVGLSELKSLVDRLSRLEARKNKHPIVLVPGFSGWDAALFGTLNYWGGFENLAEVLQKEGFTVIATRIGPLSSNWERACEVYAQLRHGSFDTPEARDIERDVDIDYGKHWPPVVDPLDQWCERTKKDKRAVLFGKLQENWRWSAQNPVHFICHSQGGNTVRYLAKLMEKGKPDWHPDYFSEPSRDKWIKSIVTLGTPHKGTTIISVLENLAPDGWRKLLAQLIGSASYASPLERFYDLHLDHWGFTRSWKEPEDFKKMLTRLQGDGPGTIANWISPFHNINGFYDNCIEGVAKLNEFAAEPTQNVHFFTMSFTATVPFPKINLNPAEISRFPTRVSGFFQPINSFLSMGLLGGLGATIINGTFHSLADQAEVAIWVTDVANDHLNELGYPYKLPHPGPQIPRKDMLPLMAPTAYGMGGYKLTKLELRFLNRRYDDTEFQPNDGIVNTVSMRGPNEMYVKEIKDLGIDSISKLQENKGFYLHIGRNMTLDHADEIGVFFNDNSDERVKVVEMYKNLAALVDLLP